VQEAFGGHRREDTTKLKSEDIYGERCYWHQRFAFLVLPQNQSYALLPTNVVMLRETARYKLPHPGTTLVLSMGSIAELKGDAIVNSANPGCLNGGGVDGAIAKAGGKNLARDRYKLPVLGMDQTGREIRCESELGVSCRLFLFQKMLM
jgi:hypothetical protein